MQIRTCHISNEQASTLVDLLIVAAVVSVVAAVLYPVFAKSKEKDRQQACADNLRQLGLATLQYALDNDDSLIPGCWEGPQAWAGRIYPYVKNSPVFVCPDDPTPWVAGVGPVSYGMNQNLVKWNWFAPALKLSDLHVPARTVLLFEVSGSPVDVFSPTESTDLHTAGPPSGYISACGDGYQQFHSRWAGPDKSLNPPLDARLATGTPLGDRTGYGGVPRHSGGALWLATDGHVEWLLPTQVSTGPTAKNPSEHQDQTGVEAAGTDNMTLDGNAHVTLTFSSD